MLGVTIKTMPFITRPVRNGGVARPVDMPMLDNARAVLPIANRPPVGIFRDGYHKPPLTT